MRRKAPLRRWWSSRTGRTVAVFGMALGLSSTAGLVFGSWQNVCADCPSIAQIYVWEPIRASHILDARGRLIDELFIERRTPVSVAELPPYVAHAFIAVED